MLIVLTGPDLYRRQEYLKKLTAEFVKKHESGTVDRFSLDGKDELERLAQFSASQGLFSTMKLGVISAIEEIKPDKELKSFFKEIDDDKDTTLVLLFEKKPTAPFKTIIQNAALSKNFEALIGGELTKFILAEGKARGAELSTSDAQILSDQFSSDTWSIVTELEKIALGATLGREIKSPQFFPLIQRINGKFPTSTRLSALAYLLENEEPAAVFNITASMTRGVQKNKMADYDVAIKSGKLEYTEALLDFVLQ